MFHYINKPRTPPFPTGMVKTESDFIIRSAETNLGKWTLVVVVISIDSYYFLTFSDVTYDLNLFVPDVN